MQLARNHFVFQRMTNQLIMFSNNIVEKEIGNENIEEINFERGKDS